METAAIVLGIVGLALSFVIIGFLPSIVGLIFSIIVLKKKKDSVIVAEGNYNESVHWGREITKSELEETGFYVDTRY